MKNELLYETQELFNQAQGDSGYVTSVTPGVAYIVETGTVPHFNRPVDWLIAIYEVNDISTPTKIYGTDNMKTGLKMVTIDKDIVPLESLTSEWQFTETGVHKIIFHFSSLETTKADSFNGCDSLVSAIIPERTKTLGARMFKECHNLERVDLKNTVTIGEYCFENCTSLKTPYIPDTVRNINNYAFKGCILFTEFANTNTITYGSRVFSGCTNLVNISVKTSAITAATFASSGKGTGSIYVDGNWSSNGDSMKYKKLTITGNLTSPIASSTVSTNSLFEEIRVLGKNTWAGGANGVMYPTNPLKFFEVLDNFIAGNSALYFYNAINILHLGYNDVISTIPGSGFGTNNIKSARAIYVGPGNSEEEDQIVLNKYLEDSNWSSLSAKLYTWYSYNGPYKQ